jgi:hypothetical protein
VLELAPVVVFGLGILIVLRSAGQLAAIATYATNTKTSAFDVASGFDPGNYRIHVRLAQAYLNRGDCASAKAHARSARGLFPNAAEPKRVLAACGSR